MLFQVCSFYDSKTQVYSRPFFLQDIKLVPRVALDVRQSDNDIGRHPEDFSLFHIGQFCDQTASFECLDAPVCMVRMHEVVLPVKGDLQ